MNESITKKKKNPKKPTIASEHGIRSNDICFPFSLLQRRGRAMLKKRAKSCVVQKSLNEKSEKD